jgi:hypothetical protein
MTTIELEIDSLVLDGLDHAQALAFVAALRHELAAGLVSTQVHSALVARGDAERLGTASPIIHSGPLEPLGLGRATARALTTEVIR